MGRKGVLIAAICVVGVFFICILSFVLRSEKIGELEEPSQTAVQSEDDKDEGDVEAEDGNYEEQVVEATATQTQITETKKEKETLEPNEHNVDASHFFYAITSSQVYNNELQIYISDKSCFNDNRISLAAEKIGDEYISGKVESKRAFRYGEFTFKINLLNGKGLFPAIWMLPQNGEMLPEVDIMEQIGSKPRNMYGVVHCDESANLAKYNFTYTLNGNENSRSVLLNFKWTKGKMVWSINGKTVYTLTKNVPDEPMFMVMNLAVGGNWPGSPDAKTRFPAVFNVDIVKFEPMEIYER